MPIVEIPEKSMVIEFPDDMDVKEIERQIYTKVYDQDVISEGKPQSFIDKAQDFVVDKAKNIIDPWVTTGDEKTFAVDNPYTPQDMPTEKHLYPVPTKEPSKIKDQIANQLLEIGHTAKNISKIYPALEAAATFVTNLYGVPISGIAGLMAGIGESKEGVIDLDVAAKVMQKAQEILVYQPKTKSGQELTETTMYPFEKLQQGAGYVGDKTLKKTGNPYLATAAHTAIEALPILIGARKLVPKITETIKQTNMYRKATIPERGLVVQSLEETIKKNPKMTEAELVKTSDQYFQQAMEKRKTGETTNTPKTIVDEPVIAKDIKTKLKPFENIAEQTKDLPIADAEPKGIPIKDNRTGGMTPDIIKAIPDPVVRAFAEGRVSVKPPKQPDTEPLSEKADTGIQEGVDIEKETQEVKVLTDRAERQKVKTSLAEGELILKTGKFNGKKRDQNYLKAVQRSVDNAKAKLGIKPEEIKITGKKDKTVKVEIPKQEADALKPKEQKAFLLKEINTAIKAAPHEKPVKIDQKEDLRIYEAMVIAKKTKDTEGLKRLKKEYDDLYSPYTQVDKITIKVPGDGEFTLINNKTSLTQFKKKMRNFPANTIIKMPKSGFLKKAPGIKPLNKRVRQFAGEYVRDYTPRKTPNKLPRYSMDKEHAGGYGDGFYTNNQFAIRISKPKTKRPLKDMTKSFNSFFESKKSPAVIEKEFYTNPSGDKGDGMLIVNVKSNRKYFKYNPENLDIILKKYPKAKPYVTDAGILLFEHKGKPVGFVAQTQADQYGEYKSIDKGVDKPTGYAVKKETPSGHASADTFADIPIQAMEMPEITKLAKDLMKGRYPQVKRAIGRKLGVLGDFLPMGKGRIRLRADLFKDINQASKTLAHEIGHLVDYLDDKTMKRGNILGRIASLKKFMKRSMESKPGGAKPLTDADRKLLKDQAKKLLSDKSEQWIDEVITKETPITAQDVVNIWNSVEGSLNKNLLDYIKGLSTAEKKAIVKDALKGRVKTELQKFANKKKVKTGKKIKVTASTHGKKSMLEIYKDLIEKEIKKRQLLKWEDIQKELKDFTLKWKPFNPKADAKFTKYRFSSPELYADALSAIITNPGYIKTQAPKFFQAFYDFLENKPMVKDIYAEIMSTVNKTDKAKAMAHIDDIYKMFQRSTEKRNTAITESRIEPVSAFDQLATAFDQLATALWDQSHEALKAIRVMEKIPGVIGKDAVNARMAIQELQHTSTVTGVYLADFNTNVLSLLDEAGYTLDDLGVVGFLERIAKGDRSDKANPLGIDQSVAERDLSIIGKDIWGLEKFNNLKGFLGKYRTLRTQELYPVIRESAILKPKMMDYIEENTHHVKWDVAAYFDKTIGGGKGTARIYKQVGTLNEIDNPIVSTVLQDISLLRASLINLVKQDLVTALKNGGLVEQAQLKYSLDAKTHKPVTPGKGKGILTVFETSEPGKPHHYYVSKDIAEMFEYNDIQSYQLYSLWFNVSRVAKELMVGKNPAWMLRNLDRDFKGTIKNVPGIRMRHIPEVVKTYFNVIPEVYQEAYNRKSSERIRAMKKARGLPQYRMWSSKDVTFDNEISRQLTEFRVLPDSASKASRIPKAFTKVWDFLDNTGYASEIWGKVAADKYLDKKSRQPQIRKRARITRELAGTPDSKQRSKYHRVLNSIALFSEMRKAGLRQMSTAYKADKSGYIWKTFMMNVLPKVMKHFMLANGAAFGIQAINKLFEDDEKKKKQVTGYLKELSQAYVRIPSYDQEHYQCIPLGLTSTGKAAYLRIPMDYEGQIFGTIGYLTAKEIMNQIKGGGDLPETYKKLAKTVSEQTPYNFHPIITTAKDLITYTMGDSPKDWKGYDVIPKNISNTGGETYLKESAPYIWRHLLSNFGVRNFVDLGHGNLEVDKEWYESLLRQPGLSAFGSYLKFSDRGLQEKIQREWDKLKERKAEVSLDRYKGVIKLANGETLTLKEAASILMNPNVSKKQLKKAVGIKSGSVYAKMLTRAKSEDEKTIVLLTITEQEQ